MWNVQKAAVIGAALGAAYAALRGLADGDFMWNVAATTGQTFGAALGGALLFAVVAVIRNRAGYRR